MRRFRFPRGFGHLFGLLFLIRHPIFLVVFAVIGIGMYLYQRRR